MGPRRRRSAVVRLVIAVAFPTLFGCATPELYPCTDTSQCQSGRTLGTCEPEGYCSFPDGACASGRRFGELAATSLAGQCVADEVDEEGSSSSSAEPGSSSGVATSSDAGSESTGEPLLTIAGSSSEDDSTSGIDEPASSSSSSSAGTSGSTSSDDDGCIHSIVDDFENGVVAAAWTINAPGGSVDENGGQLEISTAGAGTHAIVTQALDQSLLEGYVRVTRSEIDDSTSTYAGVIAAVPGCDFQLYAEGSWMQAYLHRSAGGSGVIGDAALPDERPVWLQVRRDAEGVVYFEYSTDETDWELLASEAFPECGEADVPHTIGILAGGAAALHRFEEIATCLLP